MSLPQFDSFRKQIFDSALKDICEGGYTPYILVNNTTDSPIADIGLLEAGKQQILNLGPNAVVDFKIENDILLFSTAFSGTRADIVCPLSNVLAIFAKEAADIIYVDLVKYCVQDSMVPTVPAETTLLARIKARISQIMSAGFTYKPLSLSGLKKATDEPDVNRAKAYKTLEEIVPDFIDPDGRNREVPFVDPKINYAVMSVRNQQRIRAYVELHKNKPHRHLYAVN